jgi:chromosome segregation ATPase
MMVIDNERRLATLREILDSIYLDASQSHSDGTTPCDLTIIFTALATLTVSYEDVKEDVGSLKDDIGSLKNSIEKVQTELHDLATTIKVCDAANQGKKAVWMAVIAFFSGGLGLALIKWVFDTYLKVAV